jgi:uncharacterized protein (DUF1778 family)
MREEPTVKRRHTEQVLLRFDPEQLALIDEAADQAGLNRTGWLRMTALRVAKEELGRGAKDGAGAGG